MDHEQAEEILNGPDLHKRSYTENLAVLNYQVADLRADVKDLLDSQESQWKSIRDNEGNIKVLEERQNSWNRGLMLFAAAVSSITGTIAAIFGSRN